jgi:hypothetical protein
MQDPKMAREDQIHVHPQQTTVVFEDNITFTSAFCSGNMSKVARSASGGPYAVTFTELYRRIV